MAAATLAWAIATTTVGASGGSGGSGTGTAAPGQIILKLQNSADLPAVAAQYQLNSTPLDQLTVAPLYLMQIADGASAELRAAALASDSRVAYAETNVIGSAPEDSASSWNSGGNAAAYLGQWAPTTIGTLLLQEVGVERMASSDGAEKGLDSRRWGRG